MDLFLVVLQITEGVATYMEWMEPFYNAQILRLVRLWRIFSNVALFDNLRVLILAIVTPFKSLLWLMFLVLMLTYAFGIVITRIVTVHKISLGRERVDADERELEEYFGTLARSIFVLFKAISEGIHWGEVSAPLAEFCSPWFELLFGLYMFFVLFAVLNVVTATFVEGANVAAVEDKQKRVSETLLDIFESHGVKPTEISRSMFESKLHDPRMGKFLDLVELNAEQACAYDVFGLLDVDGSGYIEAQEIIDGCTRLGGPAKSFDIAKLAYEFFKEKTIMAGHRMKVEETLETLTSRGTAARQTMRATTRSTTTTGGLSVPGRPLRASTRVSAD